MDLRMSNGRISKVSLASTPCRFLTLPGEGGASGEQKQERIVDLRMSNGWILKLSLTPNLHRLLPPPGAGEGGVRGNNVPYDSNASLS